MMQAVMWGLLGLMVGLAALVGRSRAHPARGPARPERYGRVSIAWPAGWTVSRGQEPSKVSSHLAVVLTAQEPIGGRNGSRVLTVTQEAPDAPMSPDEYLAVKSGEKVKSIRSTVVGERRWVWVKPEDEGLGREPMFLLYGSTVLSTGEIVTLRLEGPADVGSESEALFWLVADQIQFHDVKP